MRSPKAPTTGGHDGFVGIGTDNHTAAFAVTTIGRWWDASAQRPNYEDTRLLITADAGGSNGYRGSNRAPF